MRLNRQERKLRCPWGRYAGLALRSLALLLFAASIAAQARPRTCGSERWPVKVLADRDTGTVQFIPAASSVAELAGLPRPAGPFPPAARLAPHERTAFRVRAVLRQVISESDSDLHLVLQDTEDSTATMVAEIPDSACALTSSHKAEFAAARLALRGAPKGAIIELDGVGFFDFLHGQRGVAPNGFELHPVLAVRLIAPPPQ